MTVREDTPYGFRFGELLVERCMELPGRGVVVSAKAGKHTVDIFCSTKGRSLRVFKDGVELTAQGVLL